MAKLNTHFQKLSDFYLFPQIEKKVAAYKKNHPEARLINLGVGDVTKPISPTLLGALSRGVLEMGDPHSFRGYGPSQGYAFLREAIVSADYRTLGISADEIFIADGAKCSLGALQDLFSEENSVLLCDPTYPVYFDTSILAGKEVFFVPCLEENQFLPEPPDRPADLIFLCSPNNPTGVAFDRKTLLRWVEYARNHQSIIIYDGAYEAYITSDSCPRSIYEIEGAREVALEVRSFSKTAGFTGLRCSYLVVPKETSLHAAWLRRTDAKFGGVSYPVQKCAAAIYTPEGSKEVQEIITNYRERTQFLLSGLKKLGYTLYGGTDSPYLFCKTPQGLTSWQFFDHLLEKFQIISVPGSGFGVHGEGFVRLSGFAHPSLLGEALLRLKDE